MCDCKIKPDLSDEIVGEIKFTFDPNYPKQVQDIKNILNGKNWYFAVVDFERQLRDLIKFDQTLSEEQLQIAEKIKTLLHESILYNNVSLDDYE